jgi:hypothetical protein
LELERHRHIHLKNPKLIFTVVCGANIVPKYTTPWMSADTVYSIKNKFSRLNRISVEVPPILYYCRWSCHCDSSTLTVIDSFMFFVSEGWWNTEYCFKATENMTENHLSLREEDYHLQDYNLFDLNFTHSTHRLFWR